MLEGDGQALRKATKPDFESACVTRDGILYVLGSGATDRRRRIARIPLERPGTASVRDAPALFAAAASALGDTPNIEAAVVSGARLTLFHRGAGGRASAMLGFDAAVLDAAAAGAPDVTACDLGSVDGVPLGFTDAVARRGGGLIYLAAAEDTADAVADGPVIGGAIGVIDGRDARWAPLVEADGRRSRRKVEGLALADDGRSAWLVTDPDDPARPAELCRAVLAGPWT